MLQSMIDTYVYVSFIGACLFQPNSADWKEFYFMCVCTCDGYTSPYYMYLIKFQSSLFMSHYMYMIKFQSSLYLYIIMHYIFPLMLNVLQRQLKILTSFMFQEYITELNYYHWLVTDLGCIYLLFTIGKSLVVKIVALKYDR